MVKNLFMFSILALSLSACSLWSDSDTESRIAASCTAYAATLETVADLAEDDRLNESQIHNVDRIRAMVNPVCSEPPEDVSDALQVVSTGLHQLSAIEKEVKDND